jgi:hypothetical protein
MSAGNSVKSAMSLTPDRFGSGLPRASGVVTIGAASSAEIVIPGSGTDDRIITLKPTVNCHIGFGIAGMAAADTNDLIFFGGARETLVVPRDVTTMRVIQAAGASAGFLSWHVSSTL